MVSKLVTLVLVQPGQNLRQGSMPDWWTEQIVCLDVGARNPSSLIRLQVSDVDTGVVHWVNADFCPRVVLPRWRHAVDQGVVIEVCCVQA